MLWENGENIRFAPNEERVIELQRRKIQKYVMKLQYSKSQKYVTE